MPDPRVAVNDWRQEHLQHPLLPPLSLFLSVLKAHSEYWVLFNPTLGSFTIYDLHLTVVELPVYTQTMKTGKAADLYHFFNEK